MYCTFHFVAEVKAIPLKFFLALSFLDVQFWSRKSLEGLSVQSVFFNVFQSLIVLLYIMDNETNFVVIVSVFIGLLIEMWKVTKVVVIKIDREDVIAGVIPRIKFIDKPSYVQSSTKVYDRVSCLLLLTTTCTLCNFNLVKSNIKAGDYVFFFVHMGVVEFKLVFVRIHLF